MIFMTQTCNLATILVVEDDIIVSEIICAHLKSAGYATVTASDVASALSQFDIHRVELAIVDVNLPDGLGFDLAVALRKRRDCGVIYLTSRSAVDDLVAGFAAGGDDYIVKPADPRELSVRVDAVLRRFRKSIVAVEKVIAFAGWTLDLVRRELADGDGLLVPLTRAEFDLFAALVQSGISILDRSYLLEVVRSTENGIGSRSIDVLVSRIRRKIARASKPAPQIVTYHGQGYSFRTPAE